MTISSDVSDDDIINDNIIHNHDAVEQKYNNLMNKYACDDNDTFVCSIITYLMGLFCGNCVDWHNSYFVTKYHASKKTPKNIILTVISVILESFVLFFKLLLLMIIVGIPGLLAVVILILVSLFVVIFFVLINIMFLCIPLIVTLYYLKHKQNENNNDYSYAELQTVENYI